MFSAASLIKLISYETNNSMNIINFLRINVIILIYVIFLIGTLLGVALCSELNVCAVALRLNICSPGANSIFDQAAL